MKYYTGGELKPNKNDIVHKITVNDVIYIFDNKFKNRLRDMFIDWGTYHEIYNKDLDKKELIKYIVKLFNLDELSVINKDVVEIVKSIYNMSNAEHMDFMNEHFMLYEPVSVGIRGLFFTLKDYYEKVLIDFINIKNQISNEDEIIDYKKYIDNININTSSPLLFSLNPDNINNENFTQPVPVIDLTSGVDIADTTGLMNNIKNRLKTFNYKGFCPYAPKERLLILLQFPIQSIISVIKIYNNEYKSLDFTELIKFIKKTKPLDKPKIHNSKRKLPPKDLTDDQLIKWYIMNTLEMRKTLSKKGKMLELYYIKTAKNIINLNKELSSRISIE